jgi:hypothetical protein
VIVYMKRENPIRALNERPIFASIEEAVRSSAEKHGLAPRLLPSIIRQLHIQAAERDRGKDAMLDLFLCGEIEISFFDLGRGAVFTARSDAEPPRNAKSTFPKHGPRRSR